MSPLIYDRIYSASHCASLPHFPTVRPIPWGAGMSALVDRIRREGQQHPVVIAAGMLVAGAETVAACDMLSRPVKVREYEQFHDVDLALLIEAAEPRFYALAFKDSLSTSSATKKAVHKAQPATPPPPPPQKKKKTKAQAAPTSRSTGKASPQPQPKRETKPQAKHPNGRRMSS